MGLSRNILKMNKFGQVEPFTFILSTKNYKHLGKLNNVKIDTVDFKANLNSANEISFEVYKKVNDEVESLWNDIIDLKSIYVPELDEYFEIQVVYNDKLDELKMITGTSLCEAELSQTIIRGTEINTETDIDRSDYKQTTFYNELDPKASLLNRVLSFVPHYSIGYVDPSLHNIQRSFSIDGTSVYDFLVGECSEQFNCIFVFDSTNRTINVYDLYTTCYECGHRDAYNFVCPECGSTNVNYFGQDTTIFVNKENLSDDIKLETDVGSIKNCFRLRAGDEDMTADVVSVNPNGTAYIYYITPEQRTDMSEELVNKIDSYDELVEQYTPEYQELSQDIRDLEDEITYYESTMMPSPVIDGDEVPEGSIAKTEIVNLTVANLSPIGIEKLSSATSKDTADTVVKNYARVFVNTSLVKIDVVESTFVFKNKNSEGWNYGIWTGKLQLTAYSDANDIAITDTLTLTIHDNYGDFLKQKVMKDMALNDEEGSVFDVLSIEDINDFKEALTKYCRSRLESFRLSLDTAITTLMSLDQASEEADWYASIYVPYHEKLLACADEIIVREATINELEKQLSTLNSRKSEIQAILNFENYLGTDLYLEFCTYRREDEYHNENYISDGLTSAERIDKAKEFLEVAKKELIRSATGQHTISANLYNIMLMEEFKPLVDKFALGNFIRVEADNELYRLRLNSYNITFSDLSIINTEFSDMTKDVNVVAATQKILANAQSMASNFSYISKQAEKGKDANESVNNMVQEGLNSAHMQIKNNVNEEAVIDNNGYLGRSLDDVTGKYLPEQIRITHNILAFTDDNWAHCRAALGKHNYYKFVDGKKDKYTAYGLTSDFVTSGVVSGSQMIGGEIYSDNYKSKQKGTYLDLRNGDFQLAGGNFLYDSSTNKMTLKGVTIEWDSSTTPGMNDINGLGTAISSAETNAKNYADNKTSDLDQKVAGYLTAGGKTSIGSDYVLSPYIGGGYLNISNGSKKVIIDPKNYTNTGYIFQIHNGSEISVGIKSDGTAEFAGKINAKEGGTISGFDIGNWYLQSTNGSVGMGSDYTNTVRKQWAFWAGYTDGASTAPFQVYHDGTVNASKVNITGGMLTIGTDFEVKSDGTFTAKKGTIANFTIGSEFIQTTNKKVGFGSDIDWAFWAGYNESTGVATFRVKQDGTLIAKKGTIADFDIGDNYIQTTNKKVGFGSTSDWAFWAGYDDSTYIAPFRVNQDGAVYAKNLTVTGGSITLGDATLNADGLTVGSENGKSRIGNFKVDHNSLYMGTWSSPNTPEIFIASSSSNENYTIAGVSSKRWAIGAGGNFGVTLDGEMYCKSGKIGGLTINSSGTVGSSNILIHPDGYKPTGSSYTFYLVIYNSSGQPVGGIAADGWHSISA